MKRLNGIIESEFAPSSKNDMWLYKGSLKYFGSKGWTDVKGSGASELAKVATTGDYKDLINTPSPYTLPVASLTTIGGVKKATNIANLAAAAELTAVVNKVNAILSALKVADIMVKD